MTTRRGKAAVKEEPVEAEAGEDEAKDYTVYAGKEPTATMSDFHDWLVTEVYDGVLPFEDVEEAFLKGVHLGGTLRMEFQRSEFNRERRAERKAARPAAETDEEDEAPAKPASKKVTRTKPAAAVSRPAKAAPATRRRGGKPAAAAAEAAY